MTARMHLHATDAEARRTLAAIDAARGPTEELWDVVGYSDEEPDHEALAKDGLAAALRGRWMIYRPRTAPTRPWMVAPVAVGTEFGTTWKDVLLPHEGKVDAVSGGTVPRARDAVEVERDLAAEDAALAAAVAARRQGDPEPEKRLVLRVKGGGR